MDVQHLCSLCAYLASCTLYAALVYISLYEWIWVSLSIVLGGPCCFLVYNVLQWILWASVSTTGHSFEYLVRMWANAHLVLWRYQWLYGFLYRFANGPVPDEVRKLDSHINSSKSCGICLDKLGGCCYDEAILICGHRYHAKCIRNWESEKECCEIIKVYHKQQIALLRTIDPCFRCPLCRTSYQWNEKWGSNFILDSLSHLLMTTTHWFVDYFLYSTQRQSDCN